MGETVHDDVSDHCVGESDRQLRRRQLDGEEDGRQSEDERRVAHEPVSPVENPPEQ